MRPNLRRTGIKRLPNHYPEPLAVPAEMNKCWSMEFMSDALFNSRRFRTFNVVDDRDRKVLHIENYTSITSRRLVRIFDRLRAEHGLPEVLRTDDGLEFLGETFTGLAK